MAASFGSSEASAQETRSLITADGEIAHESRTLRVTTSRKKTVGLVFALLAGAALVSVTFGRAGSNEHMRKQHGVVALSSKACNGVTGRSLKGDDPCDPSDSDMSESLHKLEEAERHHEKHLRVKKEPKDPVLAKIEAGECTAGGDNCNATKCCNTPGMQCYEQSPDGFAQCKLSCALGPDPTHWNGGDWACNPLGSRTPGSNPCADEGEDCSKSQCCNGVGLQCYSKNSSFASCKVDCVAGAPDMSHEDSKPWACKALGTRSKSTAAWVWDQCSKSGENCGDTRCCSDPGMQCYAQSDDATQVYWGLCRSECNPGVDPRKSWEPAWSCHEVGSRTPSAPVKGSKVAPWSLSTCSNHTENCMDSKCCLGVDVQCYQKNDTFAQCMRWCTPGGMVDDNNETWTCEGLSARSWGLATKGFPSLFCFSLSRTTGYEVGILRAQYDKKIGIFACDDSALLAADGVLEFSEDMKSLKVEPAQITTSQDGTAGNAKLFVNVWTAILKDGRWRHHAWTVKADPDAVVMPMRLRNHMAAHTGERVFVVNCNKFTNSPNFPMMYGAVEIYSNKAMESYEQKGETCLTDMGMMLPKWGEDFFMTRCMDHIGVGRIGDWFSLGDQLCMGANCSDPRSASYHPFKDLKSWMQCHDAAVASE